MEPPRRNWTAQAMKTLENHEAWARSFVADPALMTGVFVLDVDPPSMTREEKPK